VIRVLLWPAKAEAEKGESAGESAETAEASAVQR